MPTVPYFPITPVNFKLLNFTDMMKIKAPWYSDHFLAFTEGDKMCLKVYVSGDGNGAGTHVSIYLFLMRGPYDDELQRLGRWPLRGVFTIILLNQCGYGNHSTQVTITFDEESCNKCTCTRVEDSEMADVGWGNTGFIPHETLFYQNNAIYLKDNSLHFQISYKVLNPPITYYQVAPVIVHMPGFTDKMKNGEEWFSVPFFAYERGYQMQLIYKFDDNNVKIFLILMKGPHDDNIQQSGKWPLRGRFAIELLNQLSYDNHWLGELVFSTNSSSECTNRATESDRSHRFYGLKFISTDAILHPNIDTCDYFKDGSLYFRISYEDIIDVIQGPYYSYPVVPFTIKKSGHATLY